MDFAVKRLESGSHFASKRAYPNFPAVVGHNGIGSLEDGTLVSFRIIKPPYGSMAEKVVIPKALATPIPEGITAEQASVIPSAALSTLRPLKYIAKLQPGETVLINGATSVSGMLAVQVAKHLGAGRNPESGEKLIKLGADAFINLNQPDEKLVEAIKKEAGEGYDVILDYLWDHPAEVMMSAFTPAEISIPSKRTRFILIGVLAGATSQLSGLSLLTSGLEIYGFMGAQIPPEAHAEGTKFVWNIIKQGILSMVIVKYPLKDIEKNLEHRGTW